MYLFVCCKVILEKLGNHFGYTRYRDSSLHLLKYNKQGTKADTSGMRWTLGQKGLEGFHLLSFEIVMLRLTSHCVRIT